MIATLAALAIAALVAPVVMWRLGPKGFYVIAAAPAGALAWVLTHWPSNGPRIETVEWVPRLHMTLVMRMDTLAAVMSVLILGIGTLVLCYCANYFDAMRPRVAVFGGEMLAFAAAMFGLVVSDNMLVLYVFWEATTVLSFLLVGFYGVRASSRRAATQALLVTTLGGLAMLGGIIALGSTTGSYLLSDLIAHPPAASVYVDIAIGAILIGALSKSAIVPLHFWLPGAMAAPTPVSAYLHAAAMVKAGVYLVARLAPGFATLPVWQVMVLGLGALTMLVGGWRSLRELDLKLILAFGTVSQLGFLMVLLGFGDANVALAGITMLVAHAMFKAALFMVVGIIDHSTGTRDLRKLARLGQRMPALALIAGAAAASMAGLPFTFGFVAKEAAFGTIWTSGALPDWQARGIDLVLLTGAVITMAYSTRFLWGAFGRKLRPNPSLAVSRALQPSAMFLAPPAVLAVAGIVSAFSAGWLGTLFEPYADTLPSWGEPLEHLGLWHGFGLPLLFSVIAMVGGVGAFLIVRALRDHLFVRPALINADRIYDATLRAVDAASLALTRTTQRGSLPVTQGVILATMVVLPTVALFAGARSVIDPAGFDSGPQAVVALLMLAAALGVVILRNRLAAVLAIGLNGYGCVFLFARYGAPDLALTQALVETLTLVIFVLVLRKLPAESPERPQGATRIVRAVIAVAVGVTVSVLAVFAAAARSATPLHEIIPDIAYRVGHGANAVNVLLVDIRAWDTLGEISVLIVAATGVASMVFRNRRFGAAPRVADADNGGKSLPSDRTTWLLGSDLRDPRHRSLVLEATTRLVFPTMVVLSVFFFYSGHNSPGGGFAGGLTMGLALVLRYLAGGRYELGEALPIEAGTILGTGLAISGGTAAASLFFGAPALSSAMFEVTLPLLGEVKIVTALFFDLGIYLIVVGLVLDILRSLGARLDVEADAS
ncbi:Na+/H+ antiporter subunit A [Gordonia crocea]|uniref:Putative cation antiporter NADH dehydrogenase subunit n=1 Tax=Gordonia crocea TaxID=589162 RepID=A0A7M3SVJ4_9ACTN|nr:Na+/H+ antiporter subunit A [Gordonia crocea]GED96668.1 putative cation antiporter NADH dehydrogenase subunit [Gordonia crocea]